MSWFTCGTIRLCIDTGRREGGGKDEKGCREKEGGEKEEWETWLVWLCVTGLIWICASLASFQDPALLSIACPLHYDEKLCGAWEWGYLILTWYHCGTGFWKYICITCIGQQNRISVNFTGYTTKTQRCISLQMQLGHWVWVLIHSMQSLTRTVSPLAHVGHMWHIKLHVAYQITV